MTNGHLGKICPYCQFPLKQDSYIVLCTKCSIPHHRECWEENGGCTTFGCSSRNFKVVHTDQHISSSRKGSALDSELFSHSSQYPSVLSFTSRDSSINYYTTSQLLETGPQIRPWVRFIARTSDLYLFTIVISFSLIFFFPVAFEINEYVYSMAVALIFVFVEPIMLSTWGTTPCKALLNIKLRKENGSKLTYSEALSRSIKVYFRGEGLYIPIINLVTRINAYDKLKKDGITSWDREGKVIVVHRRINMWCVIVVVLLYVGVISLIILGNMGY